jgi:hypothetical protein
MSDYELTETEQEADNDYMDELLALTTDAYNAGYTAGMDAEPVRMPYKMGSDEASEWADGLFDSLLARNYAARERLDKASEVTW